MASCIKIALLMACLLGLTCLVQAADYPLGKGGASAARQPHSDNNEAMNEQDIPRLFEAVMSGNLSAVRTLVQKGSNVNQSINGVTPLCFAIEHPDITRFLIEKGADVNVPFTINDLNDPQMRITVLVTISWMMNPDIINLAFRHGLTQASAEIMWSTFITVGMDANLPGSKEAAFMESMRLMLEKGANVNAKGFGGATPLMMAVKAGSANLARMLIDRRADVNAKDDQGRSALTIAKMWGKNRQQLIDMLVRAGAGQ
jgi:ankyrin repeat protein